MQTSERRDWSGERSGVEKWNVNKIGSKLKQMLSNWCGGVAVKWVVNYYKS